MRVGISLHKGLASQFNVAKIPKSLSNHNARVTTWWYAMKCITFRVLLYSLWSLNFIDNISLSQPAAGRRHSWHSPIAHQFIRYLASRIQLMPAIITPPELWTTCLPRRGKIYSKKFKNMTFYHLTFFEFTFTEIQG